MKRHLGMIVLAVLVVAVLLISTVTYQVDELTDIVLIKTFGRVSYVVGLDRQDAGLHLKWPWPVQRAVRYDARTFIFEGPNMQLETKDKQNMLATIYCAWRIRQPERFHKVLETIDAATTRIRQRLQSIKVGVIGKYTMSEFVNTDPAAMRLQQIEDDLHQTLRVEFMDNYGIEVREVGLKVLGLSEAVSDAVIDAQKQERMKYVAEYQAAGEAEAQAIRDRAIAAANIIRTFAENKAAKIRSEGEVAAAQQYAKFEQDPMLAKFIREMQTLEEALKGKTVMILDGDELPAIKYFQRAPTAETAGAAGVPVTNERRAPGE